MEITTKGEQAIIENLKPVDIEERFAEILDETHGTVKIMGLEFSPSQIVRELDPTAFSCGVNDYADSDDDVVYVGSDYYDRRQVDELLAEIEEEDDQDDDQ